MSAGQPWSLTPRQRECLQVLQEIVDETGAAPSFEELRVELELSGRSRVLELIRGLEERGWIERMPGRYRAIRILRRIPMPDFATPEFVLAQLEG